MSKVFITQKPMRWDERSGELVPVFDLEPAAKFGELVFLLKPNAKPFDPSDILPDLRRHLEHITEEDHLLLVGNPVLMGLTSAVAAEYCEVLNFLQWNGKDRRYYTISADLSAGAA